MDLNVKILDIILYKTDRKKTSLITTFISFDSNTASTCQLTS